MTAEQRRKLRDFISKATELDGAELCMDAEGMTVEKDGYTIAYFPHDCEPMSDKDEAYNKQVRFNAGLFLTCRDNQIELTEQVEKMETALRACIARAGNPDAAEGCRQVIRTAQDALEGKEGGYQP